MNFKTVYLGKQLPHPLIVGAGPLGDDLDTVRALEDAGAAMLVMRSLCEEEIIGEQIDDFINIEGVRHSFAEADTFGPEPRLPVGPDEYLEHLQSIKTAVRIPVIGSLNGFTLGGWLNYAKLLEEAGADGIELHIYHAASDMTYGAGDVERQVIEIVRDVKHIVRIPIAVKLTPLHSAFANFAGALDNAGADGLVLFTRFYPIDIDVDELEVIRTHPLSDSSELPMRLRGTAALAGRIKASIAVSGGVHTALDVIKATMAGADAVQMVSALLRHGPSHIRTVLRDIESWMAEREWEALSEMRGNMSLGHIPDPAAYERANFRLALR
jgi:dihydroorotate dehydrogenase (fumarate)